MEFENTLEFAKNLDKEDTLSGLRDAFYFPVLNEKEVIYLAGNSLGLQPKKTQDALLDILGEWATFGTEGYLIGDNPWMKAHEKLPPLLANLTGALPEEIVVMNQLTTNLHLLLGTFYRPEGKRRKILIEGNAFPSDDYVVRSQMELHKVDPAKDLVRVMPRQGELIVRNEDILQTIRDTGDELALVLLSGVNHHTGQVFFMKSITAAAHEVGALCGFDLAHAVGNIELKLHEWGVDFAVWCSYKYLNGGPGAIGGAFIHEKYTRDMHLKRLQGWWGVVESKRFVLQKEFVPTATAAGWQLSIPSPLSLAILQNSLELFEEAGFQKLMVKRDNLTDYLLFILDDVMMHCVEKPYDIITPMVSSQHGSQISLLMSIKGKHQHTVLKNNRVITTWSDPQVIRVAPAPLYNTFQDIFNFGKILEHAIHYGEIAQVNSPENLK